MADVQTPEVDLNDYELVPIDQLEFAPYNPRQISAEEFADLKRSLETFGAVEPAVVNRHDGLENVIIGGHMRVRAASELGWKAYPTYWVDVDDRTAKLMNLALNKISGEWDTDKLNELLWQLNEDGGSRDILDLTGFDVGELEKALNAVGGPEPEPPVPDQAPKRVSEGEVWEVGRQRLMCGDSKDRAAVERLLDGREVDLIFTSPPYNVGMDYGKHDDSTVPWQEYRKFLLATLEPWLNALRAGRAVCWQIGDHPSVFPHRQLAMLEDDFSLTYIRTMIWDKVGIGVPLWYMTEREPRARRFTPDYQHEVIYLLTQGSLQEGTLLDRVDPAVAHSLVRVASATASRDIPDAGGDRTRYRALDRHANKVHQAAYPVKLVQPFVHHFAAPDELVGDPFCGVGSTLIAAEREERAAVGMEIDPSYCDVALERMAQTFDLEPRKVESPVAA